MRRIVLRTVVDGERQETIVVLRSPGAESFGSELGSREDGNFVEDLLVEPIDASSWSARASTFGASRSASAESVLTKRKRIRPGELAKIARTSLR